MTCCDVIGILVQLGVQGTNHAIVSFDSLGSRYFGVKNESILQL